MPRLPLYARALALLALNLLLLGALLIAWTGWGGLLSGTSRERLSAIGDRLCAELSPLPASAWPAVLERYDARYGVRFSTFLPPSRPGEGPAPGATGPRPPPDHAPPSGADRAPPPRSGPPPRFGGPGNRIELQSSPWWGPYRIVLPGLLRGTEGARPLDIQIVAAHPGALARLLGVGEWLRLVLLAAGLSALVWAPFFVGLVRNVKHLQAATRTLAEGRFDLRLPAARSDELGALAGSINHMAERLESHLDGQKRFLADVAHETISPLARIQVGLGLLETRVGDDSRALLQDVQDDARQMSELLHELLLFSRAGLESTRAAPETLALRPLVLEAIERESANGAAIDISEALQVRAHRALLLRALGNLIRNAARHGGGTMQIGAEREAEQLRLWVRDDGPGVPAAALAQLGQPFFRPDASRNRDSGGYGLGLAIVRRCVETCGGDLRFRNRAEGGFEAELHLPAA